MKNVHRLYAFMTGMLLAFDFTGFFASTRLPRHEAPEIRSDSENLAADWVNVGNDFRKVMWHSHE